MHDGGHQKGIDERTRSIVEAKCHFRYSRDRYTMEFCMEKQCAWILIK